MTISEILNVRLKSELELALVTARALADIGDQKAKESVQLLESALKSIK